MFKLISEKLFKIFSKKNSGKNIVEQVRQILNNVDMHPDCVRVITEDIESNLQENHGTTVEKSISKLLPKIDIPYQGEYLFLGNPGIGKTSLIGKIAYFFKQENISMRVISLEKNFDQLKKICENIKVDFSSQDKEANTHVPLKLFDAPIINFQGNNFYDDLNKLPVPRSTKRILVIHALSGHQIIQQAVFLCKKLDIYGLAITNCDSDNSGIFAINISYLTQKPILFLSTGEKIKDLEFFDLSLISKMLVGCFELQSSEQHKEEDWDLYSVISYESVLEVWSKSSGLLNKFMKFSSNPEVEKSSEILKVIKVAYDSMTEKERRSSHLLKPSQLLRIARGAGIHVQKLQKADHAINNLRELLELTKNPKNMHLVEQMQTETDPRKMNEIISQMKKNAPRRKKVK